MQVQPFDVTMLEPTDAAPHQPYKAAPALIAEGVTDPDVIERLGRIAGGRRTEGFEAYPIGPECNPVTRWTFHRQRTPQ